MFYEDFLPILSKAAEKFRERAQKKLKYCITCQPYDGGDYIWFHGEETTIDDILDSVGCPERYREDISGHLHCPNCGKSGFEQYETAGTEDRYIIEEEKKISRVLRRYSEKLEDFRKHLEEYPSLALNHYLGRKLLKEIENRRVDSINLNSTSWSRARIVNQSKVFNSNDMHAPELGLSEGGRFHHPGQSVLYLADSDRLAMEEAINNPNESTLVWIQKFAQINVITDILDLRYEWNNMGQKSNEIMYALLISRYIFEKVIDRNNKWRPQYFITTFIADCARKAGFNGILYSSSRSYGENLVLFNPNNSFVASHGNPKVIIYEVPKPNKYDADLTSIF